MFDIVTFNNDDPFDASMHTIGRGRSQIGVTNDQRRGSFDMSDDGTLESNNYEFNLDYALQLLERFQEMNEFTDWDLKVDDPNVKL